MAIGDGKREGDASPRTQESRPDLQELAARKAASILSPDPNDPCADTFHLHFPDAVEEVEGREFWLKHLAALLAVFAEESMFQREEICNSGDRTVGYVAADAAGCGTDSSEIMKSPASSGEQNSGPCDLCMGSQILREGIRAELRESEAPHQPSQRVIELLVSVRDYSVNENGYCVVCLADPHSPGCVIELVEKFVQELDEKGGQPEPSKEKP